jgi:exodeoxyribonuclease-5
MKDDKGNYLDTAEGLTEHLLDRFRFSPTAHQYQAFHVFAQYYLSTRFRSVYLLKGSAGTGKTSLIATLSGFFKDLNRPVVMMAPTGRAAKVISKKTKALAKTLHRHIYITEKTSSGVYFHRAENRDHPDTVYVIDEASMLGEEGGMNNLLRDVIEFVMGAHTNAMLIITGDEAQLPPVGSDVSPALDADHLKRVYQLEVYEVRMRDVKRQALESAVLLNANKLRMALGFEDPKVRLFVNGDDVRILEHKGEALEEYSMRFDSKRQDKIVLITFSNYWANIFNKAYRASLYEDVSMPQIQDRIMVVKNNYAWSNQDMPFLANGETGIIQKLYMNTLENRYGLQWIDADIEFENLAGTPVEMKGKVILTLLDSPDASLSHETFQKVVKGRKKDAAAEKAEGVYIDKDPYINALQIKYAYAITGHKSQGGQWEEVIIAFEPMYPHVSIHEYVRWSYTAITRAERRVYLLQCPFIDTEDAEEVCYRNNFVFNPDVLQSQGNFSDAERAYLEQFGPSLIRLLNGQIPANTAERKRMIQIVNKELEAHDLQGLALRKYIDELEKYEAKLR